MFNKFKLSKSKDRIQEEALYEVVAAELENGDIKPSLWVKAVASSYGDDGKAKSLYIRYRVQSLIDEKRVFSEIEGRENLIAVQEQAAKEKFDTELSQLKRKARKKVANFKDLTQLSKRLGIKATGRKGLFKDKWDVVDRDGRKIKFYDSDDFEKFLVNIFDSD